MKNKENNKKKNGKKVTFSLSERDSRILLAEAQRRGVRFSLAARQLLHAQLQQLAHATEDAVANNQLNIFDSVQIDIFNNTSKTKNKNRN